MSNGIKRGHKEFSSEQRLKKENKQLKRQLKQLRKQFDRIPLELYDNIRETIERHDSEEMSGLNISNARKMKKIWECHNCREDSLKIIVIPRRDGTFYFRKCPSCGNRTKKLKKYSDDVEGVR